MHCFLSPSLVHGKELSVSVDAKEGILMEAETRKILVKKNINQRIQPASFTKIVTLYLVFEAIGNGQVQLSDMIPISERAWHTGGSQMFLKVDTRVPLEELIKGIAVVSGNDACVAVAEYLQGSVENFVQRMNELIKKMGLKDTHFNSPNGLPAPNQYTTAHDMAIIAANYTERFPQALRFHALQKFTYAGITQKNRNGLLRRVPDLVDGLKTGYVADAGYHLIATGKKKNMRLIAVVMGAKTPSIREKEALKLLYYGFGNFVKRDFFDKGEALVKVPVWKGKTDEATLIANDSGHIVIPLYSKSKVTLDIHSPQHLFAPLKIGEKEGKARIISGKEVLKSVDLVIQKGVLPAGIVKRLYHTFLLLFYQTKIRNLAFGGLILLVLMSLIYKIIKRRTRKRRRFY